MWSLPNINNMNSQATRDKKKFERATRTGRMDGEQLTCEHAGDDCDGELRTHLWYDIFSDDPKGVITLCDRHDGFYGNPDEGFFYCDSCERTMILNYTWELYRHLDENSELCLRCYAEQEIANEENWITLTPDNIAAVTFTNVRAAKHLLAVEQTIPSEIQFYRNVECDNSTGGRLTGVSSSESSPDGAVRELRELLTECLDEGHKRAILILDGAYQFSVSIGVYVDSE